MKEALPFAGIQTLQQKKEKNKEFCQFFEEKKTISVDIYISDQQFDRLSVENVEIIGIKLFEFSQTPQFAIFSQKF